MNRILIFLLSMVGYICIISLTLIHAQKKNEITFVIDKTDSLKLPVHQALLYRNVDIGYDSTVLIQSKDLATIRQYPQLRNGQRIVLRIIAGQISEVNPNFYDIYLMIGDSIPQQVRWLNEREMIYIGMNGRLTEAALSSEEIHGEIQFAREKGDEISAASLNIGFRFPFLRGQSGYNNMLLKGAFSLKVGDYRELTMGESDREVEKQKKKKQNLAIAIVLTIVLIAVFGLR